MIAKVIDRTWSWRKSGQYYKTRQVPYSVSVTNDDTLDSTYINKFLTDSSTLSNYEGVVAAEVTLYTLEECDYWICKLLGHKWGAKYDVRELNKTGAYTAKRLCARCGKIDDMGICIRGGGSFTIIPALGEITVEIGDTIK